MLLNRHPEQFIPKTDVQDPVAVAASVEQLKRWARAKLKKSSLRDVAGRGGKLEQLEIEFAHRGFQDIFYLTRFELSLPPSRLNLPRPSQPIHQKLIAANYPIRLMPKSNSASSLNDRERGGKRRETFVEEEQPRTSTSSKDGDVRRMTFKEVTWGKQQELQVKNATDGNEATPTKIPSGAPSSPPSPILYVPPRPAPPKVSDQLESIVGIESPKALGIASTTPTLTPGPAPRPISSMPNSGLLTPTNISGSAQQTPSTVNEPLPITPSSARTSSLGWPTATANFRVSGIGFNLAAVNPAFAAISGPRRGSEGTEHVPAQVKMQLPQHRRPSAPFLTVPQDPEGYASEKEGEDEEQLEEGPPKLDLRIGVSSSTKGGGQNPSTAQKQVTETSSKAQMDLTALETRDEAMRKILEDKIRALQSALLNLDSTQSALPPTTQAPKLSLNLPASPPKQALQTSVEKQTPPSLTLAHASDPPLTVGVGQAPSIPLPPVPMGVSSENRRPKPPPLKLKKSNLGNSAENSIKPSPISPQPRAPSPLRKSTIPEPMRNVDIPPTRPARPGDAMINTGQTSSRKGSGDSALTSELRTPLSAPMRRSSGDVHPFTGAPMNKVSSSKRGPSQPAGLAPSPTILTSDQLSPLSGEEPSHAARVMASSQASPPAQGRRADTSGGLLLAPNPVPIAPRLSILGGADSFLSDNWLSDFESEFDLDSASSVSSMPFFPPPPNRLDPNGPPKSAPATQTTHSIAPLKTNKNRLALDDTSVEVVKVIKIKPKYGSKSANASPHLPFEYDSATLPPLEKAHPNSTLTKSPNSFPPRIPSPNGRSPKSRSNSLPGDDPIDLPRPYGRPPPPAPTHNNQPPTSVARLSIVSPNPGEYVNPPPLISHPARHPPKAQTATTAMTKNSRDPPHAALAISPNTASRLPIPSRRAPIPGQQQRSAQKPGQDGLEPEPNASAGMSAPAKRVHGYRQSISARYADKPQIQSQAEMPVVQPQPQIQTQTQQMVVVQNQGEYVGFAV